MQSVRVLHVDDDRDFLALASKMLDRVGDVETVTELDPTAVPDRLEAEPGIECVLCDYDMPGWSGLEVLQAVREAYPDLPFVLYTGKGSESVAAEVISLGATDYIPKGSDRDHFESVADRIERAVADYRERTGGGPGDTHRAGETDGAPRSGGKSDARLGSLGTNAPFPIAAGEVTTDGSSFVVDEVNPAFEATFGYDAESLSGESLEEYVVPPDEREGSASVRRAALEGEPFSVEVERETVDGRTPFLLTVVPEPAEAGDGGQSGWAVYVEVSERARQRGRVRSLHEVALDLAACGTPAAVSERVVSAVGDVLDYDRCVLSHERDGVLEPVAAGGAADVEAVDPCPVDERLSGRTYRTGEGYLVNDVGADPDATAPDDVEAVVSVPVGEWGTLQVGADERNAFSKFDLDVVYLLAAHASAALDRIAREQETRTHREQLNDLHEATRKFMAADSVESAAEMAVGVAADLLSLPLCVVREHCPETGDLRVIAEHRGVDGDAVSLTGPQVPGDGLSGRAFETSEVVTVNDTAADDETADGSVAGDATTDGRAVRSGIAYPLGDHGVLAFGAPETDAFDPRDERLGRVLADNLEAVFDRLERERALRRREAQLKRQNERLERFASLVSHDLRTPLEVVRGNVELARLRDEPDRLDEALTGLDRADDLIDDMLAFARHGQHVTDLDTVELARVAEDAWPAATGDAVTRDAESVEAALACETGRLIEADEPRLRQLLANLFRNAIEHNDDPVTVRVLDTPSGFAVADDGSGLPSLDESTLFDPGTSTRETGTGFGLSIVREIAEAHGWTVTASESAVGGARFDVDTVPDASE
jgi:PAS domain S-box-containing protein